MDARQALDESTTGFFLTITAFGSLRLVFEIVRSPVISNVRLTSTSLGTIKALDRATQQCDRIVVISII